MKVAVIGLGWWGPKLLRNFVDSHLFDEVIACDTDAAQVEKYRSMYGISGTTDVDVVLQNSGIGAVAVATPPRTHYELTRRALMSGKHVLVEKPPTLSVRELEELTGIASKGGLTYMVDSTFIFSDPIRKIKELLDSGYFDCIKMIQFLRYGDVLRQESLIRLDNAMLKNNIDVLGDLLFHDLSILVYFYRGEITVRSVNAGYNLWDNLCDTAYIDLSAGNSLVHIGLSWTLPERRREIVIFDKEKFLVYNDLVEDGKLKVYSIRKKSEDVIPLPDAGTEPLQNLVRHFMDCILHDREPLTGGRFMLGVMRTFERIKELSGQN